MRSVHSIGHAGVLMSVCLIGCTPGRLICSLQVRLHPALERGAAMLHMSSIMALSITWCSLFCHAGRFPIAVASRHPESQRHRLQHHVRPPRERHPRHCARPRHCCHVADPRPDSQLPRPVQHLVVQGLRRDGCRCCPILRCVRSAKNSSSPHLLITRK